VPLKTKTPARRRRYDMGVKWKRLAAGEAQYSTEKEYTNEWICQVLCLILRQELKRILYGPTYPSAAA
jgi:hypothetical protein